MNEEFGKKRALWSLTDNRRGHPEMTRNVASAEHSFTNPTASDPTGLLFEMQIGVAKTHHLEASRAAQTMSSSNSANLTV
jgi:hypothetical protein